MNTQGYPDFIDPKQYPDFWDQVKGFKEFVSEVGQTVVSGSTVFVSEELIENRLNICSECNQFNPTSKRCYLCGCFMEHKAKFKDAECPMNMW